MFDLLWTVARLERLCGVPRQHTAPTLMGTVQLLSSSVSGYQVMCMQQALPIAQVPTSTKPWRTFIFCPGHASMHAMRASSLPGDHLAYQVQWNLPCMVRQPSCYDSNWIIHVMASRWRPAQSGGRAATAARATGTAPQFSDIPDPDSHTAAELANLSGHDGPPAALSPTPKLEVSLSSTPANRQL